MDTEAGNEKAQQEKSIDNLKLWNSVCKTDPKFTKQFTGKGGFKGTAICAQWQRHKATELWGPFGKSWGVEDEEFKIFKISDNDKDNLLVYRAKFYYPEGGFYINSEISIWTYSSKYKSWSANNDMYKKVSTDALTKGLSLLGFSSDVFMGLFDDNKYVTNLKEEFSRENEKENESSTIIMEKLKEGVSKISHQENGVKWKKKNKIEINKLPEDEKEELKKLYEKRMIALSLMDGDNQNE